MREGAECETEGITCSGAVQHHQPFQHEGLETWCSALEEQHTLADQAHMFSLVPQLIVMRRCEVHHSLRHMLANRPNSTWSMGRAPTSCTAESSLPAVLAAAHSQLLTALWLTSHACKWHTFMKGSSNLDPMTE